MQTSMATQQQNTPLTSFTQQEETQVSPSTQQHNTEIDPSTSLSAVGDAGCSSTIVEEFKRYIDIRLGQFESRISKLEERVANVYSKIPVSNGFSQAKIDRAKRMDIDLTVNLVRNMISINKFDEKLL